MAFIKKYNGSAWETVPVKLWDGSQWVEPEVKKWDGSKWSVLNRQQYTKTWEADWSQTYSGNLNKRTDDRGIWLGQGQYTPDNFWGLQRSLAGFPDMRYELLDATIDKVEIYLKNEHWYYSNGGTVVLGYHNHQDIPDRFTHSEASVKSRKFSARGEAQWIEMPKQFGEGLRDGSYKGFSLYSRSSDMLYYGFFYGAKSDSFKPKIKITYTK